MNRENVLLRIVTIGLYVAPLTVFLYLKHTIFPLITLKVFSFSIAVELLLIAWLLLVLFYPKFRPRRTTLTTLLLTLIGVLFISSIFGVNFSRSLWSVQTRAIGLVSLLHFAALFLVLKSVSHRFNWRRYLKFIFLVSLVVSLVAFWQRLFPGALFEIITNTSSRPGSFFGNPSFLALYLLLTVFIGGWLAFSEKRKLLSLGLWIGVAIEAVAIFLTGTRGAILGLLSGVFIMLIFFGLDELKKLRGLGDSSPKAVFKNIPALIIIFLFIFGGIFFVTRSAQVWQSVPGLDRVATISLDDITTKNRLVAWNTAWQAFLDKPIFGWGFENFKYGFDTHYNTKLLSTGLNETFWDKPHNVFLEYLSTTGIVGFLSYISLLIWFLVLTVRRSPRNFKPFGVALLVGYAIGNAFIFDTFGSYLMFFVVLAFLDQYSRKSAVAEEGAAKKKNPLLFGATALIISGMIYLVFFNVQIMRASNWQYHGINFILNQFPEESMLSYQRALRIKQPYIDEIRFSFLGAISDGIDQVSFQNIEDHIDEALQEVQVALSNDPNNYRNYITLSKAKTTFAHIKPELIESIEGDIEKAIALAPNRQENYYALAQARLQTGNQIGAYEVMQEAINLDSEVGEPHFYYGLLALQLGDNEIGWSEIKLAEELGRIPQKAEEFRVLANFYGDNEEYDKAIDHYRRALTLQPFDMEARLKLGIVYYYVDRFDEAKNLFDQVLEARPDFIGSPNYEIVRPIFEAVGVF